MRPRGARRRNARRPVYTSLGVKHALNDHRTGGASRVCDEAAAATAFQFWEQEPATCFAVVELTSLALASLASVGRGVFVAGLGVLLLYSHRLQPAA